MRSQKNKKRLFELIGEVSNVPSLKKTLRIRTRYVNLTLLSLQFNKLKDSNEDRFMNKNPKYAEYSIGRFSYGQPTVLSFPPDQQGNLSIGSFCSIGVGVVIVLAFGAHEPDWITTYPFALHFKGFQHFSFPPIEKLDVVIGNDVWIGMNATILPGVRIGDGAVIGANSLVTRDVPAYSIVAGNPAKIIRMRFDEETINQLLRIKWWDWDLQRIADNMPLLLSNKLQDFVKKNNTFEM